MLKLGTVLIAKVDVLEHPNCYNVNFSESHGTANYIRSILCSSKTLKGLLEQLNTHPTNMWNTTWRRCANEVSEHKILVALRLEKFPGLRSLYQATTQFVSVKCYRRKLEERMVL